MTSSRSDDMAPHDWVIISSINWSENWQMHQQLATSLVDAGHRVLFIENTGVRAPRKGDLGRIWNRLSNWFKSTSGFNDVRDHLTLLFPLVLPMPYSRVALFFNRHLLSGRISNWMKVNRFHNPIVVSFLPTPLALAIANDLDRSLLIYYCANDMSAGSKGAARLRQHEEVFMTRADAVFCISSVLMERARKLNKHVSFFPPGVDHDRFTSALQSKTVAQDLTPLRHPVVGYVGAIGPVFDQALLVNAARQLPDLDFVLVGPICTPVEILAACPNIHLFGARAHELIPHYLNGFSVGLIPYVRNTFTDAVYCCKLNEYLAMGLPVVATGIREVREFNDRHGGVIDIANDVTELVTAIRRNTVHATPLTNRVEYDELRDRRLSAAAANTWAQRYADLCTEVQCRLLDEANQPKRWQDQLSGIYRRSRHRMLRTVQVFLLVYVLVFFTPLFWLAGSVLVSRVPAQSADAIVIFASEGAPSFVSVSYQKRAIDALTLYQGGYASRIFITSSKDSSVSESEVIKALLLRQGVPTEAVSILDNTSRSMAESVKFVAIAMRSAGVQKALLVSAPYSSLRARLVWGKQSPDIEVFAPAAVDNPSTQVQWQTSTKVMRAVVYEYLAVAFYWFKGWL